MSISNIIPALLQMCGPYKLLLTGGFGKALASLIDSGDIEHRDYILFEGGLRFGATPKLLRTNFTMQSSDVLMFVDDTIYGGKTKEVLTDYLSPNLVIGGAVVYDGCPIKKEEITSLYRYYDVYPDKKPNFNFQVQC